MSLHSTSASTALRKIAVPAPRPMEPEAVFGSRRFYDALNEGRFQTTACEECGRLEFPPVTVCPSCGSRSFRWPDLTPRGILFCATRVHAAPARFDSIAPYRLGVIDQVNGLRLLCLLLHPPGREPRIGEPIELVAAIWENGPMLAGTTPDDQRSTVVASMSV